MKVCIIGAGSSGIVTAKTLSQSGIDFDCYEKGSFIGYYTIKNNPELMMGMHEGPMMRQKGDNRMHNHGERNMKQRKQMNNCK